MVYDSRIVIVAAFKNLCDLQMPVGGTCTPWEILERLLKQQVKSQGLDHASCGLGDSGGLVKYCRVWFLYSTRTLLLAVDIRCSSNRSRK